MKKKTLIISGLLLSVLVALSWRVLITPVAPTGVRINTAEDALLAYEGLRIETSGDDKYFHQSKFGQGDIRIWVRQGENDYGKFSSYQRDVERNVGFMNLKNLDVTWYFPTNNQNIIGAKEAYILDADGEHDWFGSLYSVVIKDTDGDESLTPKDKFDLYFARKEVFELLAQNVDEIMDVVPSADGAVVVLEKGGVVSVAVLNTDGALNAELLKLNVP